MAQYNIIIDDKYVDTLGKIANDQSVTIEQSIQNRITSDVEDRINYDYQKIVDSSTIDDKIAELDKIVV